MGMGVVGPLRAHGALRPCSKWVSGWVDQPLPPSLPATPGLRPVPEILRGFRPPETMQWTSRPEPATDNQSLACPTRGSAFCTPLLSTCCMPALCWTLCTFFFPLRLYSNLVGGVPSPLSRGGDRDPGWEGGHTEGGLGPGFKPRTAFL